MIDSEWDDAADGSSESDEKQGENGDNFVSDAEIDGSRLRTFLARRYEIKEVRYRAVDRAARYALSTVFSPASAAEAGESEGGQIVQAYLSLGDLWRRRLLALRGGQWAALAGSKISFARNCAEVGVRLDGYRGRPCGLRRICPWCWCRAHVQPLYHRLWLEIHGPSWNLRREPLAVDVVDRTVEEYWAVDRFSLQDAFDRAAELREWVAENEVPKYYGAFQLTTVEPPDPRQPVVCWRISHRCLVLSSFAGQPLSDSVPRPRRRGLFHTQGRVRVTTASGVSGLTQRQLTAPVGRVCLYPSQMLRGPVEETVAVLEMYRAGARVRTSEYYRGLRNASRLAREAQLRTLEEL